MSAVLIIAEAGVNHNGDVSLALEMVEVAAACGADAIKFQSFDADKVVVRGAAKAEYQRQRTGEADQHSMLQALELSPAVHREVAPAVAREHAADVQLELRQPHEERGIEQLGGGALAQGRGHSFFCARIESK